MSILFSPVRLAGTELANRIVVSPMCQYSANDGCATDWHMMHLGMLANSGAALVVVEATAVERIGRITHGCVGLYSDDNEMALARVVRQCRRLGTAKFGIQLAHAARKASAAVPWDGGKALAPEADPWPTLAPSAIPFGDGWPAPRAATPADFARIRDAFVASAKRALRIGFDAIELHMAHGYLFHSLMSPLSNRRTDDYGGSFENRMRFPLEVARAVRAVVPKDVPLGARITGSDWREGGLTPDDAVRIAKALKGAGLDFLCVSSGGLYADIRNPNEPGYNVAIAERVTREAAIPTRVVGLILEPQQAEAIVASGKADMVALGRALLDDPHWGWHAAKALKADVARPPQYLRAGPQLWAPAASS
ncbi:MAG: NADH:flavin oxidoreductase/NADH oxidase [Xanthobacteraceae bacterium]|uniref:NADH:flavin oxidoreductase/NADH oxidase n=1 Tax=Pseudolabrys sp. TaxID=1960880 RepID=UPI003D13ABC3